jgi:hypothetical protein
MLKITRSNLFFSSLPSAVAIEEAAQYAALQNTLDDALRVCENAIHRFADLRCGRGGHHVWVSYRNKSGEWTRAVLVEEPAAPASI